MTMMSSRDAVTLGKQLSASDDFDTAIALLDERGTVAAWTHPAEQLVGYSAGDVVGRSAALVLPSFTEATTTAAFVERCRAENGWSGTTALRHRDGRVLDVSVRITMVRGQKGTARWLASMTETVPLSGDAVDGTVRGPLLARAPIAVGIRDRHLRCTYVNDIAESHDGVSPDRRLGSRFTEAVPGANAEAIEAVMRQVVQGSDARIHEYRTREETCGGSGSQYAASFQCLQGADGESLGLCVISADVAASRQVRDRLAVLSRASARLGSTLDTMQAGQELADLAVPLLADYVAVDLEHSVSFGEEPPPGVAPVGKLPTFRRAGLASLRHGVPESPWARGELIEVPADSPFTAAVRAGKSHIQPVLATAAGTWADDVPDLAHRGRDHGMHSIMVVPIQGRHTLLGVALFVRTTDPAPFDHVDLLLAEELVGRTARTLDAARRYASRHTLALTLQRHLLPRHLTGGTAVDVASRYLPADVDHGVGGDWFDVIPLSGARVALVVGDVVGHGLQAAAAMGRLRTAVHTLSGMELPPEELLAHLDDTVRRLTEQDGDPRDGATPVGGVATCLYAVYDPSTRRCTMASAGHPPPVVVDPQGRFSYPDLPTGAPLGTGPGEPFESVELELEEGSLLALYTDGLIEAGGHDIDEGMHRLGTALAQPGRTLEDLCDNATRSVPGRTPGDDVTLLLVRTGSLSPSRVLSTALPSDRSAVRSARDLAARQLAEWGLEDLEDATKLIVSELVTNAIRHTSGHIELRLIRHQVLTCEVSDAGPCIPRPRQACTTDEHGRGLSLVTSLSRKWGSRPVPGGKVVWVDQDLPDARRAGLSR
ncbi:MULTISPECIES: SpoIIE family protein phosphatase [unclassified Streptomyces]|uniref:SpoIIE family protein phosphatase n=1 Tax=unclassified Streptomyces TaxID=2593676 RepID=UPI0037F9BF07